LRAYLADLKKNLSAANTSTAANVTYVESDQEIPMRDGAEIRVRVHAPKSPAADGCPGLIVFHGGGFCLGGLDNEVTLCRKWTELGGVAVNVDYRLAPEHVFPTAVHDAYDALIWVILVASSIWFVKLT
jgi:acetyl esterase/lipase